jgi:hypothetical protein
MHNGTQNEPNLRPNSVLIQIQSKSQRRLETRTPGAFVCPFDEANPFVSFAARRVGGWVGWWMCGWTDGHTKDRLLTIFGPRAGGCLSGWAW